MRLLHQGRATSLDGCSACIKSESDRIVKGPDIDLEAIWSRFDRIRIGRKIFAAIARMRGGVESAPGIRNFVCPRMLRPGDYPQLTTSLDAERMAAGPCIVWLEFRIRAGLTGRPADPVTRRGQTTETGIASPSRN